FYQIFPDRFARSARMTPIGPYEAWDAPPTTDGIKGGDLYAIAERLDELADLGINALYLTPVFRSASNHRYHAYDYLAVDPILGGDAALRELLDRAHERGMRVILDGVFNHCGRGFWPFHHVLELGAESPYRDWFHLDPAILDGSLELNAYPDRGGVSGRDPLGYRAWWGLPALPKFNTDNPEAREYLLGVGEYWMRFGIDGWRLDVPAEIDDRVFWAEFRRRCRAVDPEAYLVGEIWDEAPEWLEGDRFDALMNYPLGTAILGFVGGNHVDQAVIARHDSYRRMVQPLDGPGFARRLEALMTTYDPAVVAVQLNLIGSHDTPRAVTVLGGDVASLSLAIVLQATLPGAPCIYYGDEIAMAGDRDPDNRRAYPVDPAAGDQTMRALVRAVMTARHEHVALRRGSFLVLSAAGGALAYLREAEGRRAIVAINPGPAVARLAVPRSDDRSYTPLELPGLATGSWAKGTITLPPESALVLIEA
ncbi:MAG: glycoside hydrolase family 13 protein, partial [Chloroflexota bacterium]|nr:glycoside hydrolase family 13 protein [Chloroflexota bacterium]